MSNKGDSLIQVLAAQVAAAAARISADSVAEVRVAVDLVATRQVLEAAVADQVSVATLDQVVGALARADSGTCKE